MANAIVVDQAIIQVLSGGIIVYPTESVYGMGCDPYNKRAVMKLLSVKNRSPEKGLILIGSHIQQLLPLIKPLHADDLARALKTWPGHVTWLFPKSKLVPEWISGQHNTIAIRLSNHPMVKQLCDKFNAPLVSTSANLSNQPQIKSLSEIKMSFGDNIQYYIDAPLGTDPTTSCIRDAHNLTTIR